MTEYKEINGSVVQDFARRTLANLQFIEQNKKHPDVYEVTQLSNSMLGLLVFPKEEFWDKIKPIPLTSVPEANAIHQHIGKCNNLRQLVRCLRNSISHFNIALKSEKGFIEHIEMWNESKGTVLWRADTNVSALRDFILYFVKGIIDNSLLDTCAARSF